MTIGAILTGGFGSFGSASLVPTLGFGGAVIGPYLSSFVAVILEIDWENNGSWTDESAYLREFSVTPSGRSESNDLFGGGTGTLSLRNSDGRFSPWNTGSAIYPHVLPGRPVHIEAEYDGIRYPIFHGYCSPSGLMRQIDAQVDFDLLDEFEKFSNEPLTNTPLESGRRTGELINVVIDDINWPGDQLIANGDFETDAVGWTTTAPNTIARSTAVAKSNDYSLQCTFNDAGGTTLLASAALTVPGAGRYSLVVWLWLPVEFDGPSITVALEAFTGATGTLSAEADMTVRNRWQPVTVHDFRPAGGDLTGTVTVRTPNTATNGVFVYIDDVRCYAGMALPIVYPGLRTLAYFSNHNRLPLNAMQLIADNELGGGVLMNKRGDLVFEDSDYRSAQLTYQTLAGTFDELLPDVRFEDLVDSVRATYPRFTAAMDESIVYEMSPTGRLLPPGLTTFDITFDAFAVSLATTPVGVTDYTANTSQDGTGTDKTGQVLVDSFVYTSGGATVTFNNIDTIPSYLTLFNVRGFKVEQGNESNIIDALSLSPIVDNKRLRHEFELNDSEIEVQSWAEYRAQVQSTIRARVTVAIVPDTDALMAGVLGANVSNRISIVDTGAPWLTQLSDSFFVESITLKASGTEPNKLEAEILLFDEDLAAGDWFRISGDVGEGLDYTDSVIAEDAALTGKRIGI